MRFPTFGICYQTTGVAALCLVCVLYMCLYAPTECFAQGSETHATVERSLVSPRGGEVFSAGGAIPITWDARSFPVAELLHIDVWNVASGNWAVVQNNIPNTGSARIVLGPMDVVRIRVVSHSTNVRLESAGYVSVHHSSNSGPIVNPLGDFQPFSHRIVQVKQLTAILAEYNVDNATIDVYSYNGRLLQEASRLETILKSLSAEATVLLHVNVGGNPVRIVLITQ